MRKSTNENVEQVRAVHSPTISFLTLFNVRKNAISVQLPGLLPNLVADVKNKYVIYGAELATTMQFSDSSRTLYDRLYAALLPACWDFDVLFQGLFGALEVSEDDISRRVAFVLCPSPYNTRRSGPVKCMV